MKKIKDYATQAGIAWYAKKLFLIMRLTVAILLFAIIQVWGSETYSQEAKLSLNFKNTSLKAVLVSIEDQTEFFFMYSSKMVDVEKNIQSVNIEKKNIFETLDAVLKDTGIKYTVNGRQILLTGENVLKNSAETGQQQKSITGKVTDSAGAPLPGVSVVIKGTSTGVITDVDGKYTISRVPENSILQFSFVGMKTQEVAVGTKTTQNVTLLEESIGIEEVVAVGYGTQKKANLTGAVSSVSLKDIDRTAYTNASSSLAAKVPGVYVVQASGRPGADQASIRIRGVGTLNDSNPLVLIDGMQGDINSVNPQDIESISVLKDAASAAIYGNRAANGVILVTTKIAKTEEKLKIDFSASYGLQRPTYLAPVLHFYDHARLYNEALKNSGLTAFFTDTDIQKFKEGTEDGYIDTDWNKIWYDGAKPVKTGNLSITGGGKKISSFVSLGYINQDGIRFKQTFNRLNVRSNTQGYFLKDDKLHAQLLIAVSKSTRDDGATSATNDSGISGQYPCQQLQYNNPNDPTKKVWASYNGLYFALLDAGSYALTTNYNLDGKILFDYKILKNLKLNFNYGTNYVITDIDNFYPYVTGYYNWTKVYHSWGASKKERAYGNNRLSTLNSFFDYDALSTEKHKLKIIGGYSQEEGIYSYFYTKVSNLVSNNTPELIYGDAKTATNTSTAWEYALQSYFGRMNYSFKDKYIFEANARYDGSSRFASGNQWGFFPSFSGAWRVSSESFMANVPFVDNLKLRASWGRLGNQNVDYYATSDKLNVGANYALNNAVVSGVQLSYLANKDLSWETTTQANIGIDVDFLKKFSAQLDVYTKTSTDVLRQLPIPATTGVTSSPWKNLATVNNKGWDFSLEYRQKIGSVDFSATLGLDHFKNEVKDLGAAGTQYTGVSIIKEGQPYLAYYGLEVGGIVRTQEELASIPKQPLTMGLGDLWYKDQGTDGKVSTTDDQVIIGNPYPDLNYSLRLEAKWKGLTFSTLIQGVQGIDAYAGGDVYNPFTWGYPTGRWWLDRWTPENPNASMPRLWANNLRNLASDFYIQDASFLRFRDITLSYSLPKHITSVLGISNMTVYGTAHNAVTITNFRGMDPERPTASSSGAAFPQSKSFTVGVQLGL